LPLAFQHDPDGTYHELAVQLRSVGSSLLASRGGGPLIEPMDGETEEGKGDTPESRPSLRTPAAPPTTSARSDTRARQASPEREIENIFRAQKEIIQEWIDAPHHPATESYRHALELYAQLNDFEFAYVTELQGIYDQTRCFFLQWLLGKEIKELINSARISAVQSGKPFTWVHARAKRSKA
jgi:hypothetical protein